MEIQEVLIAQKALEYGYENCGIIKVNEMEGFADKLRGRIKQAPGNDGLYGRLFRFVNLQETYPWAKSLVVCIVSFCNYSIPEHLDGLIGKNHLVDVRSNDICKEYNASIAFENYLRSLGMEVATDRRFGVTAMRWAAQSAGLGVVRKNNFFYTERSGSWVHIEAFLTDREMELKQDLTGNPCPQDCDKCIAACPTKSLSEPFTMSPAICISPLTVREEDLIKKPNGRLMDKWIYGCDTCQDACPYNANKWTQTEEFPGLAELADTITLEKIILMDDERLASLLASKFFYIDSARIWQWKVNALNAMFNAYDDRYADVIKAALNDPNDQVRRAARVIAEQVHDAIEGRFENVKHCMVHVNPADAGEG